MEIKEKKVTENEATENEVAEEDAAENEITEKEVKKSKVLNNKAKDAPDKAIVVGLCTQGKAHYEESMLECIELVKACYMEPIERVDQNLTKPSSVLYIGKGKAEEIKELVEEKEADIVIFNASLSPMQIRNLQKELEIPILDRTALILEIFAQRAKTREASMQVEVARLKYLMPRLAGLHAALSRQGGGSGGRNKGAGEKKIELDKRKIASRIHELEEELKNIENERTTQRKKRQLSGIPRISIVGYTNAGKSTLLNQIIEQNGNDESKKVFVKDMLFATLDTTVRKIEPKSGNPFLLSDTVGFVSDLPHDLVKAFHSTLEEVREADLLLHVVDFSNEQYEEQMRITLETIDELGAAEIPMITVYNKTDCKADAFLEAKENSIYISAKTGAGLEQLVELIHQHAHKDLITCHMLIPFALGRVVSYLNEQAVILETIYQADGVEMTLQCKIKDYEKYKEYIIEK